MKPITFDDIYEDASKASCFEDFLDLCNNYPSRVRLSLSVNIDGHVHVPLDSDNFFEYESCGGVLTTENGGLTTEDHFCVEYSTEIDNAK